MLSDVDKFDNRWGKGSPHLVNAAEDMTRAPIAICLAQSMLRLSPLRRLRARKRPSLGAPTLGPSPGAGAGMGSVPMRPSVGRPI